MTTKTRGALQRKCKKCSRPARTRGLCPACYVTLFRVIKSKQITEAEAIEQGLILPRFAGPIKRKRPQSAMSKAIAAAMKRKGKKKRGK